MREAFLLSESRRSIKGKRKKAKKKVLLFCFVFYMETFFFGEEEKRSVEKQRKKRLGEKNIVVAVNMEFVSKPLVDKRDARGEGAEGFVCAGWFLME